MKQYIGRLPSVIPFSLVWKMDNSQGARTINPCVSLIVRELGWPEGKAIRERSVTVAADIRSDMKVKANSWETEEGDAAGERFYSQTEKIKPLYSETWH